MDLDLSYCLKSLSVSQLSIILVFLFRVALLDLDIELTDLTWLFQCESLSECRLFSCFLVFLLLLFLGGGVGVGGGGGG